MAQYGTWISYSGTGRIVLAVALLAVAGGLAYAGRRLPRPIQVARPGRAVVTFLLLSWLVSIMTFLVCLTAYSVQLSQTHLAHDPPSNPIAPVTFTAVAVTFVIVLVRGSGHGWRTRVTAGVVAALAAPMIFELPFDLVVMARTYPAVPPDPALYRALFFLPLFLVEIATLSLLTVSPLVRVSKTTFRSAALMFTVFAVWASFGFGFPSTPLLIGLNVTSKLLAFATALSLFPIRRRPATGCPTAYGRTSTFSASRRSMAR